MTTSNAHQCPDCDHEPYATSKGLASHRRWVHGVVGTAKSSIAAREAKARAAKKTAKKWKPGSAHSKLQGNFPCPQCEFVAKWKGGLTHHINAAHKPAKPARRSTQLVKIEASAASQNGHSHAPEETFAASRDPLEIPLAITLGRFTEICRGMAAEYHIPERLFAARLAELVYRTQVRQPHRSAL